MGAGIDMNVLIDAWILGLGPVLARILQGEGWTTAFVDEEFLHPTEGVGNAVGTVFPFLQVDPIDARLLPRIHRDQLAIGGPRAVETGRAAGEASLVHVALANRVGSMILSTDSHAVGLGRRYGLEVRGTLYVLQQGYTLNLLTDGQAWEMYEALIEHDRRPPALRREQLEEYLRTGRDPRGVWGIAVIAATDRLVRLS